MGCATSTPAMPPQQQLAVVVKPHKLDIGRGGSDNSIESASTVDSCVMVEGNEDEFEERNKELLIHLREEQRGDEVMTPRSRAQTMPDKRLSQSAKENKTETDGIFQSKLSTLRKYYSWGEIPMEFFIDKFVEDSPKNKNKNQEQQETTRMRGRLSAAKQSRPPSLRNAKPKAQGRKSTGRGRASMPRHAA